MPKLNQIIAVVQGRKSRASSLLTESHRGWKQEAISGIAKTYTPKDDAGDKLPPESKTIHLNVSAKVQETMAQVVEFFDVVATQDLGNTNAKANVQIAGATTPFLKDQPVTVLLFLEKRLVDLLTYAKNLPILPLDREWRWDRTRNCHVTDPIETIRSTKTPEVIVKYKATTEHPAQTELIYTDKTAGTWKTTYMSSAIPAQQKAEIVARIEALQDGVKAAREEANSAEVTQVHLGEKVLRHIFGDLLGKRNAE